MSKAEELEEAQEDHDFISRVLAYLPTEMKSGYSDAPLSDESDAGKEWGRRAMSATGSWQTGDTLEHRYLDAYQW